MNPYDFVRVDWTRLPPRRAAAPHDVFTGLSGRVEATLTALLPLFLPAKRADGRPLTDARGATLFSQSAAYRREGNAEGYFIAGSSLKGLFRSVVEAVAPGCYWFCAERHRLPPAFQPCSNLGALCPACRLFGLINRGTLRLGNVGFNDAVCTRVEPHPNLYTAILSSPKQRHTAFYLDGAQVAGRKFYFHHRPDNLLTADGWLPSHGPHQNQFIRPLGPDSAFTFSADFVNVADNDLAALLYALTLEEGIRHKFGYAKPCGLGSVQVQLTRLTLRNLAERYRQGGGVTVYEDALLATEVQGRIAPFAAAIPPTTRADLWRIWAWPPDPGVTYRYPTQAQFAAHPRDPIATTDTW